jgi:superfamily II DNA or RNA helicase
MEEGWVYSRSRKTTGFVRSSPSPGVYVVEFPPPVGQQPLPEADLTFLRDPLTRLAAGDVDRIDDFTVALKVFVTKNAADRDTLSALTNSRLQVLPHQVFVTHRVTQDVEPRYMLADEVGLGKTIEAGLIFKELKARGLANRTLVVCPANLVGQWQSELESKFNERFTAYDTNTLAYLQNSRPRENPWTVHDQVVCSMQFVRNPARREQLEEVEWDLVIVDEAHHMRRYLEARPARGSNREETRTTHAYRLGETLSPRTSSFLLLTATPLQLHDFELFSLIELIDPALFQDYLSFVAYRPLVGAANEAARIVEVLERNRANLPDDLDVGIPAATLRGLLRFADELDAMGQSGPNLWTVRRHCEETRAELNSWLENEMARAQSTAERGHPALTPLRQAVEELRKRHKLARVMIRNRKRRALPESVTSRRAVLYPVVLRQEEHDFYWLVSRYVAERYALAKASRDNALGFVMVSFQKMLASSTRAVRAALSRRRHKLAAGLAAIRSGDIDEDTLAGLTDSLESTDDMDDVIAETLTATADAVEEEIAAIDELLDAADHLPGNDSKAEALIEAIRGILEANPQEKVLIFTQFLDTQNYLAELLSSRGWSTEVFNGKMSRTEKDFAMERFRKDSTVLISTEAGGEGRNLQFCHIMFNYDLPWNPMKVEQRIGRLDRIGQTKDVFVYNFAATDTLEGRITAVLHERIRLFEEAIGALDPILGEITEVAIGDLILEHAGDFDHALERFERDLEERIAEAHEAENRLADLIMDSNSFRRETVDALLGKPRLITNDDIRDIVQLFLSRYPGAVCEEARPRVYRIVVSEALLRQSREVFGVSLAEEYQVTFWPDVALEEERLDFVALGHPLLDIILRFCGEINPHFKADTVCAVADRSPFDTDGFLLNYLIEFAGGIEERAKTFSVFVSADAGAAAPVKPEALLRMVLKAIPAPVFNQAELNEVRHVADRLAWSATEEVESTWKTLNKESVDLKREKIERLAEYKLHAQSKQIARIEDQLSRLRASADPAQQRVVPAFEGQLRDARQQLEAIEQDRDLQRTRLMVWESPVANHRLVSVAYLARQPVG